MKRLEKKIIAVAGGAGGIGTGLSTRYAAEGASVVVGDIDLAAAQVVVAQIVAAGGTAVAARVDIAEEESVRAFVARCEEVYGGLDGMHANAASFKNMSSDTDVVGTDFDHWQYVMNVNAGGHLLCARYAIPAMLKRGGGSLVFTSSGAAHSPDTIHVCYSMAKAAIHALMRHVAVRWGREGIRANVIAPGVILHPALEETAPQLGEWGLKRQPLSYLGEPADIAALGALLMSDEGHFITGQVLSVDGGASMRP